MTPSINCCNSTQIDDTNFTVNFVLSKIEATGVSDPLISKLSVGEAFMSEIVRVDFEWKKPCQLNSIVLKIPGFQNPSADQDFDDATRFLEKAHSRECDFYKLFSNPIFPLKLPKFYYGHEYDQRNKDGLMIIEDLSHSSVNTRMLPGFTNAQVESLMRGLAEIHAVSWMDRSWIETIAVELHNPDGFLKDYWQTAQSLLSIKPEWFSDLLHDLKPAFDKSQYDLCSYPDNVPACVVHSDLWAANVLWERDSDGKPTDKLTAVIDWQMCISGNPCVDVARSLSLNTSAKYRRQNTDRLLRLYYDNVQSLMGKSTPFTFEQLTRLYQVSLPYVSALTGFGTPLYFKMNCVVGEPLNVDLQNELLDRARCFFEDTIEAMREIQT
ncbi:Zinc transporter SLC39A7 [Aphelenchoides besseyi]|nr:Zinc transporter SLC39A7 [Aphelenchoides besseyi]KAI6201022.1 Zinc transporter SLC39A7 [Aphelenchoides besseyi]